MPKNPFLDPGEVNYGSGGPGTIEPPTTTDDGDTGDTGDTKDGTGTKGTGGTGGTGTVDWTKFYDQLANDPMYKQALAFIDYARQMDKSQLSGNEARAQEKYSEALRRIGISKEDSLRAVMNNLAARQALESGDTKFYRGKVEEQAANAQFDAKMSLSDYVAGVEAAYQNAEFNRMMAQYNAMVNAANFEYSIWSQLGGMPGGTT